MDKPAGGVLRLDHVYESTVNLCYTVYLVLEGLTLFLMEYDSTVQMFGVNKTIKFA